MSTSSKTLSRTTSDLRKHRDISPDRTAVWTEPLPHRHKPCKQVPVVYYLSRNGHLQHPHFIQIPLSSPHGLYLQDVISRLNSLRGKGMASMYSWSSKRRYKNGYVWHDLAENDCIDPANGNEYVLKGSELLQDTLNTNSHDTIVQSSVSKISQAETMKHGEEEEEEEEEVPAVVRRRRHQSWSSFDLHEYKVYQTEPTGVSSLQRAASNASTQTDDKRRRRRENNVIIEDQGATTTTELKKHEISPPPSDSSPETLETLMKADTKYHSNQRLPLNVESTPPISQPTGKSKATSVLMQLLSCGAMSFKDCGVGKGDRFSLISHYSGVEVGSNRVEKGPENVKVGTRKNGGRRSRKGVVVEEKEYYSGSIVETNKSEFPNLRRSSSYNADR